jgi:hypothetical protein
LLLFVILSERSESKDLRLALTCLSYRSAAEESASSFALPEGVWGFNPTNSSL